MPRGFSLWYFEPEEFALLRQPVFTRFWADTPLPVQLAYGTWMFGVVLLWDLGIARAAGHPPVVQRFMAHVRKVERVTGVILLGIAAGIAWSR